jgi:TonB family protein
MRVVSSTALSLAAWLVAGCASTPPADEGVWLDEHAFRSCLGLKIPIEMLRDPSRVKGSVLLEIDVLPSGRIERASILSGSGNAALDEYLADRLRSLQCAPFERVDSKEPYSVELELNLEIDE